MTDDPDERRAIHQTLSQMGDDPRATIECYVCGQRFKGASASMASARFHNHTCTPKVKPDAPP